MDAEMEMWLDQEMQEFSEVLKTLKKKKISRAPVWMAVFLIGMVAFGFIVGYDVSHVMRVHFPIGCVLALGAWFCCWLPTKVSNIKGVRKAYEKAIQDFFQTEEDRQLFVKQMEDGNYHKVDFCEAGEVYPCRFIVGPDYWMYFQRINIACRFIRTGDIESLSRQNESTWVSYNTGGRVHGKNMAIGVSLIIKYKEGSVSAKKNRNAEESLFFSKSKDYQEAVELIKNECPQCLNRAGDKREG